jgi:hypothetical protein
MRQKSRTRLAELAVDRDFHSQIAVVAKLEAAVILAEGL